MNATYNNQFVNPVVATYTHNERILRRAVRGVGVCVVVYIVPKCCRNNNNNNSSCAFAHHALFVLYFIAFVC